MSTRMEFNDRAGQVDVDVTVDRDDGVFLSIVVETPGGAAIVDLVTTDAAEIDAFFADVERAKIAWDRLGA